MHFLLHLLPSHPRINLHVDMDVMKMFLFVPNISKNRKMGKLFVVPTPVGNLEDMTFRAVRVLKEVDLILAEDTRTSSVLLKHFEIKKPMMSHHKFNEHKTIEGVVARLEAGENIALISDAGTPGISDPAPCIFPRPDGLSCYKQRTPSGG